MTDTAGGIASAILERFSEKRAPTENEYLGENGLLYCSKCHTPVQCRVNMFGTPKIVGCVCKCRREMLLMHVFTAEYLRCARRSMCPEVTDVNLSVWINRGL